MCNAMDELIAEREDLRSSQERKTIAKNLTVNEKGGIDMCQAMDELLEDSRLEGIAKGKAERSTEIAKNLLLEKTISCETIAKCSGLSLTEVQKLAEQLECIA